MEYSLEYNNCDFYIKKNGKGMLILFIHGVACDGDYFDESAEVLKESFTVISYDRRGYSRSTIIDEEKNDIADHSVQAQVEDAAFIISEQKCGSAFIAASSAGGVIAVELSKKYPELVNGIFLYEPPLIGNDRMRKIMSEWKKEMMTFAEEKKILKALLSLKRIMGGEDESKGNVDLNKMQQDLENFRVFLYKEIESFLNYPFYDNYKINESFQAVAIGTLDKEGLFSMAGKSAAQYLGLELIKVKGYHNFPQDRPVEFAELLRNNIDKIKEGVK